jgi:hypothetical protein
MEEQKLDSSDLDKVNFLDKIANLFPGHALIKKTFLDECKKENALVIYGEIDLKMYLNFVQQYQVLDKTNSIYLIIQSTGGLEHYVRSIEIILQELYNRHGYSPTGKKGDKHLHCFVPQYCMSGGTRLILHASIISLGEHAILGRADPQIFLPAHPLPKSSEVMESKKLQTIIAPISDVCSISMASLSSLTDKVLLLTGERRRLETRVYWQCMVSALHLPDSDVKIIEENIMSTKVDFTHEAPITSHEFASWFNESIFYTVHKNIDIPKQYKQLIVFCQAVRAIERAM